MVAMAVLSFVKSDATWKVWRYLLNIKRATYAYGWNVRGAIVCAAAINIVLNLFIILTVIFIARVVAGSLNNHEVHRNI